MEQQLVDQLWEFGASLEKMSAVAQRIALASRDVEGLPTELLDHVRRSNNLRQTVSDALLKHYREKEGL